METKLAVFQSKEIRRTLHHGEWWFSVSDVVEALTATLNATDFIKKMRKRDNELSQGWGQIVTPLWLETEGGKQKVNCANPRASSASSSPSRPQRQSPLSAGWPRSVTEKSPPAPLFQRGE